MENRSYQARLILAAVAAVAGAGLTGLMIFTGAVNPDSAMLFVAMPIALAVALIIAPIKTTHGRVFQVTTVGLLLTAVAAHEGAICVILAAPLVYGIAHGVTALVHAAANHRAYLVGVPFLLLASFEGVDPDVRLNPVQSVEIVRVVEVGAAEVGNRVARGPQPAPLRSLPLRLLGVPTPHHVTGHGLRPGSRWTFGYHGSSHGPGGSTVFEVVSSAPGSLSLRIVSDDAITARWFQWRTATLTWREIGNRHTELTLRIDYVRRLDPSWYFGPINDGLLHEGGAHVLDMMALR